MQDGKEEPNTNKVQQLALHALEDKHIIRSTMILFVCDFFKVKLHFLSSTFDHCFKLSLYTFKMFQEDP